MTAAARFRHLLTPPALMGTPNTWRRQIAELAPTDPHGGVQCRHERGQAGPIAGLAAFRHKPLLQPLPAPGTPALLHTVMHDLYALLKFQLQPLMHPLAHIHASATAAGAGLGRVHSDFIRGQQLLSGTLMVGPGLFAGRSGACLGVLTGGIAWLLEWLERIVLGCG